MLGTSCSFAIVARRPRCELSETRVWKAERSSCEAAVAESVSLLYAQSWATLIQGLPEIPDCIANTPDVFLAEYY